MIRTSAFNITPPTYADGMIFVALASGAIQAFNADTLESLWVYEDPLYGQPNITTDIFIQDFGMVRQEMQIMFVCQLQMKM